MKAFTIVELVIVITVLGILAAVTVIGYNGYQSSVKNAQAKNILGDTHKKLNDYKRQSGSYPTLLNEIDTMNEDGITITYDPIDSINWFCVSTSIEGGISYYNTSINSAINEGDCDSIDVIAGKPAGHIDNTEATNQTVELDSPIQGHSDLTIYVVADIVDTAVDYGHFARLYSSADTEGSRLSLRASASGVDSLRYRIDTDAQSNIGSIQNGVRTVGRHIGWLTIKDSATTREFAYDKTAAHTSLTLTPHAGWDLTWLTAYSYSSQTTLAAVVYNAAHNETTRKLVMTWLADKYSVPLSF